MHSDLQIISCFQKCCLFLTKRCFSCLVFAVTSYLKALSPYWHKARIFLLVDLRELFFRFGVGRTKKINKKALKMTSQLVIFRAFIYFLFFFNISRKNSKTGKANQLSVLNFPKNQDRTITFNSVTLKTQKYTDRTSKKYYFF